MAFPPPSKPKLPAQRLAKPPIKPVVEDDLDVVVNAQMDAAKSKAPATDYTTKAGVREATKPAPAKAEPPTRAPVDDLDEVTDERMAAEEEIDAQNAQATQEQRARSGLMGGGLSGASSAAEGDLANQQARSKTLALQDFDRQAENDDFTDIQREAAIADLEDAMEADINGDGRIGGFSGGSGDASGGGSGGTVARQPNQTDDEYVASVVKDEAANKAKLYPDAEERDTPAEEAMADNGRPIAADETHLYFKDFETGQIFKVRRGQK